MSIWLVKTEDLMAVIPPIPGAHCDCEECEQSRRRFRRATVKAILEKLRPPVTDDT